jgi:chromosomal replication initiation ATPase DnaA
MEEKIKALIKENRALKKENSIMKKVVNNQTLPKTVKSIIDSIVGVDIENSTRRVNVVDGRRMYYRYLREHTKMSFREIGLSLQNSKRDHTTIMHSINTHINFCHVDKHYAKRYEDVKNTINIFLNAENNSDDNLFRSNEQRQTGE